MYPRSGGWMMESCLLLISLMFVLPLDATGADPELMVLMNKAYISEGLKVTVAAAPGRNNAVLPDICLQVLVNESTHLQPKDGLQKILNKNGDEQSLGPVSIIFDSSEATLFDIPTNVSVSVFQLTSENCETDQDLLLASATALLYDDRVSVEWIPNQVVDCFVNESCSFSTKIDRTHHSREGPLKLTANITQTDSQAIAVISPTDSKNAEVNFVYTFHQVGTFTAVLSVPYNLRKSVYWKQQLLSISVKPNIVLELQEEVNTLQSKVSDLEDLVNNLREVIKEMPCQLLECGKHSTCVNGSCHCSLPLVYNGTRCTEFVGCVNSPGACGNGENGICKEPDLPSIDMLYSCDCFPNVTGSDCHECIKNYCHNHGNCTVKNGQPTCECPTDLTGPTCKDCTKDCSSHGNCIIDENGVPNCECDTNFKSPNCDECVDGWTGDSCDVPDCDADSAVIKDVCNSGVCNEDRTGCDCKDTNRTGDFCQYKKCNADDVCKGSGGMCVYSSTTPNKKVCLCVDGFVVASGENCTVNKEPPLPILPPDPCDPLPCKNGGTCTANDEVDVGYTCNCLPGYTGDNCENKKEEPTTSPATQGVILDQSDNNSQLLYGGLAVFIAILVLCVAAYLAYHNREKILELFGGKKESVVEMAMRSRTKNKGYKKLPTSIHDTLTHED